MAVRVFLSYCHADEKGLLRFKTFRKNLERQGLIEDWSDHQIKAGSDLAIEITNALNNSQIFIALVSPDYIASDYCWSKEFQHAIERQAQNKLRIIPIIYEFCDWKHTPLSQKLCLPKDGKPITSWSNQNEAWLNVIEQLRVVLQEITDQTTVSQQIPAPAHTESQVILPPSRQKQAKTSLPKLFTDYDKQTFVLESFKTLTAFFQKNLSLIETESPGWQGTFEQKANDLAIASLYLEGTLIAQASIFLTSEQSISFSHTREKPLSIIGYYEGVLEIGNYLYSPHLGVCFGVPNCHRSAYGHSCVLQYQENDFYLDWKIIKIFISGFNDLTLTSEQKEHLSPKDIGDLFWSFLIEQAKKRKQNSSNSSPYSGY